MYEVLQHIWCMLRGFEAFEVARNMEQDQEVGAAGYGMRWQPENWRQ